MSELYDIETNEVAHVLQSNNDYVFSEEFNLDDPMNLDKTVNVQHYLTSVDNKIPQEDRLTNLERVPSRCKLKNDPDNSMYKHDNHVKENYHPHFPKISSSRKRSDDITMYSSNKEMSCLMRKKPVFITENVEKKASRRSSMVNDVKGILRNWKSEESGNTCNNDISESLSVNSESERDLNFKSDYKKTLRQMKNRVSARKSRQKKKAYVQSLEKELIQLTRQLELGRHGHVRESSSTVRNIYQHFTSILRSTIPPRFKFLDKNLFTSDCGSLDAIEDIVSNINKNQLITMDLFNFEPGLQMKMTEGISFPHQLYMYLEHMKQMIFQFLEFHMEVKKLDDDFS